jgi:RNA polymerase sigma-70 factor (ECF subfamily)
VTVARERDGGRTDDLLERFRAGDPGAYATLWRRYLAPLRSFLRHLSADRGAPELGLDDLLQDVHVEALRSLAGFVYRRELAFFFWLCGIARRLVAGRRRRSGRRARLAPPPSSVELLARGRRADEELALREHLDLLALALEELDPRRREAILLRYVDELGTDEAAAVLGTSPGAFRVLLARGLADLRRQLDGREVREQRG